MATRNNIIFAGIAFVVVLVPVLISGQANYEPNSELCCNGRVHPRNATNLCCGSVTYDTHLFGCCSEKLYPLPIGGGHTYECCYPSPGVRYNSVPFNYRTNKCCQGRVTPMPNASNAGNYFCCGPRVYDAKTHFCCGENVVELHEEDDCCDGQVFNRSRQACCWDSDGTSLEGRVIDFEDTRTSCCGFQLYDQTRNACCGDTIQPLPSLKGTGLRLSCCDDQPYYIPAEFCCETFERRNGSLVKTAFEVHTGSDHASCCGTCCKSHLAQFKPQGTEYNVSSSCCDNTIIHPETHECRDGKVHALNVTSVLHCGGQDYDPISQRCCGDDVLAIDSEFQCCYNNNRKYHKVDENCCGKDIVPITGSDREAGKISCCPRF